MKKKAIGSLVLVSAMAMGNMSAFAADATMQMESMIRKLLSQSESS